MDIRAVIAYYESKTSSAQSYITSKTSVTSVAKGSIEFRLKRKPAFHDKKWRQSVREWQEKASKDRKAALNVNHILRCIECLKITEKGLILQRYCEQSELRFKQKIF